MNAVELAKHNDLVERERVARVFFEKFIDPWSYPLIRVIDHKRGRCSPWYAEAHKACPGPYNSSMDKP